TRTDTELALERAAQPAFRAESCLVCNLRELQVRGLQQGPSKLASQLLDRFGRSDTCGRDELAVKGTCRLAGTRRNCLAAPSGSCPACNLLHKTVVGRGSRSLQLKRLTVLSLATWPL